jgi:hypothetical protein
MKVHQVHAQGHVRIKAMDPLEAEDPDLSRELCLGHWRVQLTGKWDEERQREEKVPMNHVAAVPQGQSSGPATQRWSSQLCLLKEAGPPGRFVSEKKE